MAETQPKLHPALLSLFCDDCPILHCGRLLTDRSELFAVRVLFQFKAGSTQQRGTEKEIQSVRSTLQNLNESKSNSNKQTVAGRYLSALLALFSNPPRAFLAEAVRLALPRALQPGTTPGRPGRQDHESARCPITASPRGPNQRRTRYQTS